MNPLYSTWKKLKQRSDQVALSDLTNEQTHRNDLFQVPLPAPEKPSKPAKSIHGTTCLPKHISGDEVIKILEEKKAMKLMEAKEKEWDKVNKNV